MSYAATRLRFKLEGVDEKKKAKHIEALHKEFGGPFSGLRLKGSGYDELCGKDVDLVDIMGYDESLISTRKAQDSADLEMENMKAFVKSLRDKNKEEE